MKDQQTERLTNRKINELKDRQIERSTNWKIGKLKDRQIERSTIKRSKMKVPQKILKLLNKGLTDKIHNIEG